jgi:hypothetical protein
MNPALQPLLARLAQLSDEFSELREGVQKAILVAELDPEMALTRSRKVLELVVREVFERRINEAAGTRPLEGLLQRLVKDGYLPTRLDAHANAVRLLGNVGTHAFGQAVTAADVQQSLAGLFHVLDWYVREERGEAGGREAPQPAKAKPVDRPAPKGLPTPIPGGKWVGTLLQPPSRPDRPLQHRDRRAINFRGREKELEALTAEVRAALSDGTSLSFVGLKGMGGIGKTALAAELAERLAPEFPGGVLWANLQEEAPADAARRWLREFHHDGLDLGPDECLRQFRQLAGDIRPLIVLDNVPRPGAGGNPAEPLLVKAAGVATLLTTRFREAVPAGVRVQALDVLPPEEARALLRSHVGPAADDDPAAEPVLRLCERLPLFVNVAGRAVANGYYSLAEYAEELRGRGLAALAGEDETGRAAVFTPSWEHLSDKAKEVFAVLALSPGEDVGPNLVRAWLGSAVGGRARRLLTELANASLLNPAADRPGRYRYHDRVRDYALVRLPLPEGEARRRLLACWADWDMVKAEFEAVGAAGLAGQYQRLRAWGVDEPADFGHWFHFIRGQSSVLGLFPELFYQQAFNQPADSPVSRSAR